MFDGTRTADETRSKPDPLMLNELMRQFGADPERTLMIGDTTHDLQLAANAGTPSIAIEIAGNQRPGIEALAADLDLREILDRPTGKLSSGQKTRASLARVGRLHRDVRRSGVAVVGMGAAHRLLN